MTKTNDGSIDYRPSLAGRLARIGLPVMAKILPAKTYDRFYQLLYKSYRWGQRKTYLTRIGGAMLGGGQDAKLRASMTYKILPYTMGGAKALENAFDLTARVERDQIEGALVECGVAEGGTSAMMAITSRELGKVTREKWLFDSYEGMPEATDEDFQDGSQGGFIRSLDKGECLGTIEQVSKLMFETLGFDKKEVHLVKGWFQDTVPPHKDKIDKIAILRLDGDWYESTKIPLEAFYDKVSDGGFIIIDDYATCVGSGRAVDEFIKDRKITSALQEDGRGGAWFQKNAISA